MAARHPNRLRELDLQNDLTERSRPVAVPFSALMRLFESEMSYADKKVVQFRRSSHAFLENHVTKSTIQVFLWLCRHSNADYAVYGYSIHRLYREYCREAEQPVSGEQFYAGYRRLCSLGMIAHEETGLSVQRTLVHYEAKDRLVFYNPLVFSRSFMALSVAAQRLYLYIVARQGDKTGPFAESLSHAAPHKVSIYSLTHKQRPVQVLQLLREIAGAAPVEGEPLLLPHPAVERDSLGRTMLRVQLNPSYLVKHVKGYYYKNRLTARLPYSRTAGQLRALLAYYGIGEFAQLAGGLHFGRLAAALNRSSLRTKRAAVQRLREVFDHYAFVWPSDPVAIIRDEILDPDYAAFLGALRATGLQDRFPAASPERSYAASLRLYGLYRQLRHRFRAPDIPEALKRAAAALTDRAARTEADKLPPPGEAAGAEELPSGLYDRIDPEDLILTVI